MLPPTPLSLISAIILCLPLAIIFTLSTNSSSPTGAEGNSPEKTLFTISSPYNTTPTETVLGKEIKINQTQDDEIIPSPPPLRRLAAQDRNDDQPLLSLASRVDPTPKPTKKLAFMFLTRSPLPFAPLWEIYFRGVPSNLYNLYVHADPSFNYTTPFRGVFDQRVIPSKPTRRNTPSLISSARRLLARALLHDGSNSMFALLSPSCIPIHSFRYTYRTLINSRRSFIEILNEEPGAHDRWAARGEDAMLPEVEYVDFRIGSQFWVLKRKHARIIARDRRLWSKFSLPCLREDTCYPEEQYFPTLLSMVDRRGCIPCTLTHVDWRDSLGGHPRTYEDHEVTPELIRRLRRKRPRYGNDKLDGRNSSSSRRRHDPFLFARKFSPSSLPQLMSIANDVVLNDSFV